MDINSVSTELVDMTTMTLRVPAYPIVHVVFYQVVWFAAVLGGASGLWWPAAVAAGAQLILHFAVRPDRRQVALRLLLVALMGFAIDTALGLLGMCRYVGGPANGAISPLWMVALWPTFASLLDDICAWLVPRMGLAVLLGALGGPLAYFGGSGFGALSFPNGTAVGLVAVGVTWGVAMIVMVMMWRRQQPVTP